MPDAIPAVLERLRADRGAAVERLVDLLRIPSVGTDPAHRDDTRRAADWWVDQLADLGFAARAVETPGHPVVVAHHEGANPAAPRVLYYGHYDVQPADPLELWDSPPFEPRVVEGPRGKRVVARGAVDDKGQTVAWLEALRAWISVRGAPPGPVSVMIEGEEECGSPSLPNFFASCAEELRADVAVVCDTRMWDVDTPAITTSLRGMVYVEATITAADRDLHSGVFGGSATNPLNVLCRVFGDLHDHRGRVLIPGFYDDVRPVSAERRAAFDALGYDEAAFLGGVGLSKPAGEEGLSGPVRRWARPTADLNGVWGGYTGPGTKTVIPAKAHAKLSCRLVPDQDPQAVFAGIRRFVEERLPADARLELTALGLDPAVTVAEDSPYLEAAERGLAAVYKNPAKRIGSGGSVPAVGLLQQRLGLDALLIGFGLDDDRVHSPNEKFELACFHGAAEANAAVLAHLAARS